MSLKFAAEIADRDIKLHFIQGCSMKKSVLVYAMLATTGTGLAADLPKMKVKYDPYCTPKLEALSKEYDFDKKQHEQFTSINQSIAKDSKKSAEVIHKLLTSINQQAKEMDLDRLYKDYKAKKIKPDVFFAAADKIINRMQKDYVKVAKKKVKTEQGQLVEVSNGEPERYIEFNEGAGAFLIREVVPYANEGAFEDCKSKFKNYPMQVMKYKERYISDPSDCYQLRYVNGYSANSSLPVGGKVPSLKEIEENGIFRDFTYDVKKFSDFDDYALARVDHACFPEVAIHEAETKAATDKVDEALKESCENLYALYHAQYVNIAVTSTELKDHKSAEKIGKDIDAAHDFAFGHVEKLSPSCSKIMGGKKVGTFNGKYNLLGDWVTGDYSSVIEKYESDINLDECRKICKTKNDCCAVIAAPSYGGYSGGEYGRWTRCTFYKKVDAVKVVEDNYYYTTANTKVWVGPKCVKEEPVKKSAPVVLVNSKTSDSVDKKTGKPTTVEKKSKSSGADTKTAH